MAKNWIIGLEVRGFKSIRDPLALALPRSGLLSLQCLNRDTGGSSGGGKSNLFEAVASALGYGSAPSTETQSWLTEEPQQARLRFESDGQGSWDFGWGGRAAIRVGDAQLATGAKAVAEERRKLLGLDPETVGALAYRPQKAAGKILSLANAELQEFLAGLLPLEAFEAAGAESAQTLAAATARHGVLLAAAERAGAALRAVRDGPPPPDYVDVNDAEWLRAGSAAVAAAEREAVAIRALEAFDSEVVDFSTRVDPALIAAALERARELEAHVASRPPPVPHDPEVPRLTEALRVARGAYDAAQKVQSAHRAGVELERASLREKIASQERLIAAGSEARRRLDDLERQAAAMRSGTCYACCRPWVTASIAPMLRANEGSVAAARDEVARGERAEAAVGSDRTALILCGTLPDLTNAAVAQWRDEVSAFSGFLAAARVREEFVAGLILSEWKAEKERLAAAHAEAKSVVSAAESAMMEKMHEDLRLERAPLEAECSAASASRREADAACAAVKVALDDARRSNERRAEHLRRLGELEVELARAEAEVATVARELGLERDFTACFGREGFLGSIFDEILAEVSAEANALLASIPNTSHVTLEFLSEARTERGTVRRGIRPVVTVGGHAAALRSGTSGGMRSAIDLAADAAVRRVVGRRTGCMPMWWFLDESFEGLEAVCKEAVMNLLSLVARDTLIVVVDHDERFKAMFAGTISLECSGGVTKLISG